MLKKLKITNILTVFLVLLVLPIGFLFYKNIEIIMEINSIQKKEDLLYNFSSKLPQSFLNSGAKFYLDGNYCHALFSRMEFSYSCKKGEGCLLKWSRGPEEKFVPRIDEEKRAFKVDANFGDEGLILEYHIKHFQPDGLVLVAWDLQGRTALVRCSN